MDNLEEVEEPPKETVQNEDDEQIEAPKPKGKQRVYKEAAPEDKRRRENRQRTPAQQAAWERCIAARQEKRNTRKEETNKAIAEKVLKKAITVKKMQIMKEKIIDDAISDSDDIPDEIIQNVLSKTKKTKVAEPTKSRVVKKIVYREPPPPAFVFF